MRFRPLYLALGFLCIGILNSHAQATWNVTSGNWSSNGSWLSGVAPLNNGTVNTTFAIGAAYTSTVDVNYSVASVNVQPGSANFSLLGSTTLTVGAGGFNDASGTNVTVDPVLTGAMVLTQSGSGTLTLNAFNTYTGNTNVSSGTLTDGGMNNFSPNSLLEVESGGTVNVANNETVSGLNNFLGSGGSVVIASGATLFLNGTPSTTFSGIISGPGDFEQDGTSTITPTFSAGWCIWVAGSRPSTYAAPESPKRGSTTLTPRPRKVERSRWRFVTRPALSDARDDLRRLG